ncbi:MAG TPA: oligosaccharide flippase family protein [Gemmatimonadales bacterium]|jgi:O-antigen/teichoic acid export membrane protein
MTRTRQFIRGVGAGYANQAVVMLVGLWMTRYLLTTIGQYSYGLWFQIVQVLAYLALIDVGVAGILPREVAHATGEGGDTATRVGEVLGPVTRVVLWQTIIAAVAASVVAWRLLPAESAAPLRLPLGLVLVTFVLTFPLRIFSGVLTGLQDLAYLGAVQLVSWVLGTAITFAFAVLGLGLTALAAGWVVGQIVPALLAWRRLRRLLPGFRITVPPLTWPLLKGVAGRSTWVAVSQVAQALVASSDLLIIGRVMGSAAVIPFVCTEKLASLFEQQPQMLLQGAQPGLAQLRSGASRERMLQAATALMTVVLVLSGGLLCLVLAVNRGFVFWWVQAPSWGGFTLTALIVARVVLGHWIVTLGLIAFCMGYERRLAIAGLINGALTVGLSIMMVRAWGWLGIPIGAIAAHLLVSVPVYLATLNKELGGVGRMLITGVWPWAWRFALLAATALFAGATWPPNGFWALAAWSTVTALTYAIVMLPIVMRPPVSLYLHPALYQRLLRLPAALRGGAAPIAP